MACANQRCGHRTWCEVRSIESIDVQNCEEARFIAEWWADKKAGIRDRDREDPDEEDGSDD